MTQNELTRFKITNSDRKDRRDEPHKTVLASSIFVHLFGDDLGIVMINKSNTRIIKSSTYQVSSLLFPLCDLLNVLLKRRLSLVEISTDFI